MVIVWDKATRIKAGISAAALVVAGVIVSLQFMGPEPGQDVSGPAKATAAAPSADAVKGKAASGTDAKARYVRPEFAREGGGVLAPGAR